MSVLKPDLVSEADVRRMVDTFYDHVVQDDLLRPIFIDLKNVDFDSHLPTMYSFWSSILFGAQTYKGAPFPVHAEFRQHLTRAHFDRWLTLFESTVDTLFAGPSAEQAKARARNIAMVFQAKMGLLPLAAPAG